MSDTTISPVLIIQDADQITEVLFSRLKKSFDNSLSEITKSFTIKEAETYLTPDEVCELLKISRPTERLYRKEGKITAYQIEDGVIRYKLSEIDKSLIKIEV